MTRSPTFVMIADTVPVGIGHMEVDGNGQNPAAGFCKKQKT